MKTVFVSGIVLALAGCANQTTQQDPAKQYNLLFSKNKINHNGCVAAFHKGKFLYLVSVRGDTDWGYISIYDPKTSLFLDVMFMTSKKTECQLVNPDTQKLAPPAQLNFIEHPAFKSIFDRHREAPSLLQSAIDAGPPYFRADGKWLGDRSALNIDRIRPSEVKTISDAESFLTGVSPNQAQLWINDRIAFVNAVSAKEIERKERSRQAMDVWTNRSNATYKIGDKVCTFSTNLFGYIEEILPARFKVHVVGQAKPSPIETKGFFFSIGDQNFAYTRIESTRWFEQNEVARCEFGELNAAY